MMKSTSVTNVRWNDDHSRLARTACFQWKFWIHRSACSTHGNGTPTFPNLINFGMVYTSVIRPNNCFKLSARESLSSFCEKMSSMFVVMLVKCAWDDFLRRLAWIWSSLPFGTLREFSLFHRNVMSLLLCRLNASVILGLQIWESWGTDSVYQISRTSLEGQSSTNSSTFLCRCWKVFHGQTVLQVVVFIQCVTKTGEKVFR